MHPGFTAPIVKYVHAYARAPYDGDADDNTLKCLSPEFGVETDAAIEIVVGALDGTQQVVRGALKYTFFGQCICCLHTGHHVSFLMFWYRCDDILTLQPRRR